MRMRRGFIYLGCALLLLAAAGATVAEPLSQTTPGFPSDTAVAFATYLGDSVSDEAQAVALDDAGNSYVVVSRGDEISVNLAAPPLDNAGLFVAKLNRSGAIVYRTYITHGGGIGRAIAVDHSGNAWVVGVIGAAQLPPNLAAASGYSGGNDGFIAKLAPDGSLVYASYLGGSGNDDIRAMRLAADGSLYLAGTTSSPDFPLLDAVEPSNADGADTFAAHLSATGRLLSSTYLAGSYSATAMSIDDQGMVYIIRDSDAQHFPPAAARQYTFGLRPQVVLAKLDPHWPAPLYTVMLGGSQWGGAIALAVDSEYAVYLTGWSEDADFPTTAGVMQHDNGVNNRRAFVSKITPDGKALAYSTYLGGNAMSGDAITISATGEAYIVSSGTPDGRVIDCNNSAVFVSHIAADGSRALETTPVGGQTQNFGHAVAANRRGDVAVVGDTSIGDFLTVNAAQPKRGSGDFNAFAALISRSSLTPTPNAVYFPATANGIYCGFYRYWLTNGGVERFGYPISEAKFEIIHRPTAPYTDAATIQYYERSVVEYRATASTSTGWDGQFSQRALGLDLYRTRYPYGAPTQQASSGSVMRFASGNTVAGAFLDYWRAHGGVTSFGLPVSNPLIEVSELDGRVRLVQYFEYARFELHPEAQGSPYYVQLSALGSIEYRARTAPP